MGQKTNSNIFRLGAGSNEWDAKYFEKSKEESTLYAHQNLQIQSYLKQFLKKSGLTLQNCRLHFNGTNLYVYISYYNTMKSFFLINKSMPNRGIKFNNQSRKVIRRNDTTKNVLKMSSFSKYSNAENNKKKPNSHRAVKTKRLKILSQYKKSLFQNDYKTVDVLNKNSFLEQILESLSLFTGKKFHVFLTLQNLNKGASVKLSDEEQNFLKNKILFFKRYSRNKFFKESLNVILIMTKTKNSAKLFSYFLAGQFSSQKRHNHFLIFLKRILTLFIGAKFSNLKGIKIIINGRFNGAPRSKSRLMLIGNIPIQTINDRIDYYQTTSYTKNGTFGIKVWLSQN